MVCILVGLDTKIMFLFQVVTKLWQNIIICKFVPGSNFGSPDAPLNINNQLRKNFRGLIFYRNATHRSWRTALQAGCIASQARFRRQETAGRSFETPDTEGAQGIEVKDDEHSPFMALRLGYCYV